MLIAIIDLKFFKKILLTSFDSLGIFRILRFFNRNKITILTIHGVMKELGSESWHPLQARVSSERLESFIRCFLKHYNFISLDMAVGIITGKEPMIPNAIVLTFDDGYRSHYTLAMPILKRYGVPITMAIATGFIDERKPFWFDRLDYVLQKMDANGLEIDLSGQKIVFNSNERENLRAIFKQFRHTAKRVFTSDLEMLKEIQNIISDLENQSGESLASIFEADEWTALLTWDEIRDSVAQGAILASHTVDHIRLGFVNEHVTRAQLLESKESIEANTKKPCVFFCYPNGSFKAETINILEECGYIAAITTIEGFNKVGDNPMTLHRINMPVSAEYLEINWRICGLSSLLLLWSSFVAAIGLRVKRLFQRI